ncbi:PR domain zinc finger protein 10 [Tyrophagus putrescentiae]|nr:PR domain zinc finger protein 10 [Tyrophagus putrescentiae]
MLAVVMVTSTSTAAYNNFSDVAETDGMEKVLQENPLQLPVNNVISDVPVFTRARTLLPVNYLYLEESLADDGGGTRRLAVFSRKSIPSKTQTGPIEGNKLYFLSQIAYSAKNYLHIFISEAVLLNQKNENNSNWTRFIQPVTSPQEQNIELITKEFAYTYE